MEVTISNENKLILNPHLDRSRLVIAFKLYNFLLSAVQWFKRQENIAADTRRPPHKIYLLNHWTADNKKSYII
jgi:hypothetical protein